MEEVVVRRRNARHNIQTKRKRTNSTQALSLLEIVVRQALISVLILLSLGIIKSVNTPVTNYLSEKAKAVLFQNIELKSLYDTIDNAVGAVWNSKLKGKEDNSLDQQTEPASVNISDGLNNSDSPEDKSAAEIDTQQPAVADPISSKISQDPAKVVSDQLSPLQKYHFIVPVEGVIGSSFGDRVHPINKDEEFHNGVDIEAKSGASIKSVLDGEVTEAGTDKTLGKYLKIKHVDGIITLYAHCSVLNTAKGKKVKQGDVIAKVGDTGASIGPHLHFEVIVNGKPVDPLEYVKIPLKKET